ESSIDLLSYLQMKNPDNCRLVSMMGVKPNTVIETMKRYGILPKNVFICSDNDNAGNKFFQRLKTEFPQINRTKSDENFKDWNDMLRKIPMQKETEKMVVYGNKIWNDATDNRDKTLVSMPENEFEKMRNLLNNSGMNYFAYAKSGTVVMAVNDKDLNWLKQISGNENLFTKKSDVSYIPPQKNIIGNAEYRYIPDKNFISCDRDTALKMAEIMAKNNIQFSGRIYPSGKATLTVSSANLANVQAIQQNVINMRKQFVKAEKADEIIRNRAYRDIQNKHFYYSKLSHEQYQKIKPFIDTNVHYSGLIRNGKVTFTVEKEDSAMFLRALENAQREVGIIEKLQKSGLDSEHISRLSAIIHRFAVDDIHESLDNFFTPQLDENQFSKMISLVNEYLSQSVSERYGEFSGLNKILDFKNEIDRNSELNELFAEHNFSDEQKLAISEMFAVDDSIVRLNVIDETFLPEEIYDYYDILHNHLEASDITIFLENRRKMAVEREKISELTPKEKAFLNSDILPFMTKSLLAWDEIEDLGYRLFEEGYNDKYAPHENASFGNGLSENRLSVLARRMQNDEDIRKDLTLGLLGGQNVFTTNNDNKFTAEYGENSITARYGNAERNISYEDLGDVFLSLIKSEYDDIVHDRTVEDLQDNIPDITVETADNLISAFENAVTSDWKGDEVKERKIKSALYDILSDEEKTEKAFISIADMKYNFKVETEKESPIHFGLLGNGITAYDISRTDKETNDYVTVAHISPEGIVKIYDDNISEEDMSRIQQEADSAREKFLTDWEKLDTISQFQRLYDRADTETMLNIGKENLSTEEKIQKYMPFVFFGEGERPQPEIEKNSDISKNKGSWFVHTSTPADGIKNGVVGRKINPDEEISGRNMEYCSGLFTDDNEQGCNIEFAQEMADLLNKNGISDLHEARNFIDNEIAERDDFSDISTEKIDISADSEFIQQVVHDVEELQNSDDEDIPVVHDITFLGDNSKFDAVKAVINTESFGTTIVDGDRLSVVIYDDADIDDVRQLVETAMDNGVYLNVSSSNFLESRFGDDFLEIYSSDKEYTLEVSMTSDAFDEPYCITKIDSNGDFIDYYEDIDGHIPAFSTIAETLDYAKKYKLDVTNNLEEIPENLFYTLQDVIDKYFGTDCYSAETVDGKWKISIADGDKVAEVLHDGEVICSIYNRGDKMEIAPYEKSTSFINMIADAMLNHNPDKPVEIIDLTDDKSIDKPLFTDADVIEEIEKSENSTDNRPFWETPDINGEQLSMFGDPVPLTQSKQSEPKKETFAEGLFVGNVNRYAALYDEITRGTGFQGGKSRVQKFYDEKKPTNKEFADFLKHEYGLGGHSGDGEISFVDHDSKGMFFTLDSGEKFKFNWSDVAEMTAEIINKGEYITQADIDRRIQNEKDIVEHNAPDSPLEVEISEKTDKSGNNSAHDKDIPVYKGEWKTADNMELYKDIVVENKRFAEMAKSVIGNGKNPAESVKTLTEEFGFERTAWLTALNIAAHPLD
ncbi:MAG: toprim domain-containing protein, partial [Ruminococcus sp.]|nr:toprim domain-containing protein [Ruminococcus sp.]